MGFFKEKTAEKILEGKLEIIGDGLVGMYEDFYVSIDAKKDAAYGRQIVIRINAWTDNEAYKKELETMLKSIQKKDKRVIRAGIAQSSIVLELVKPLNSKQYYEDINSYAKLLLDYVKTRHFFTGCETCGKNDVELLLYKSNLVHKRLCTSCAKKFHSIELADYVPQPQTPSVLWSGIIGALVGAVLSMVIWIILLRMGWIGGIGAAASVILPALGYKILGKGLDKKGIITCVIITVGSIFLANKIAWSMEIYAQLKDYGYLFTDCYKYTFDILKDAGLMKNFWHQLLIGYIITVVAEFSMLFYRELEKSGVKIYNYGWRKKGGL